MESIERVHMPQGGVYPSRLKQTSIEKGGTESESVLLSNIAPYIQ